MEEVHRAMIDGLLDRAQDIEDELKLMKEREDTLKKLCLMF